MSNVSKKRFLLKFLFNNMAQNVLKCVLMGERDFALNLLTNDQITFLGNCCKALKL